MVHRDWLCRPTLSVMAVAAQELPLAAVFSPLERVTHLAIAPRVPHLASFGRPSAVCVVDLENRRVTNPTASTGPAEQEHDLVTQLLVGALVGGPVLRERSVLVGREIGPLIGVVVVLVGAAILPLRRGHTGLAVRAPVVPFGVVDR